MLALLGLLLAVGGIARTLPPCVEATARLDTTLNSSSNEAGDSFGFTLLDNVPATAQRPSLAHGTRGRGVVSFVAHAGAGGNAGMLVLEPRFLIAPSGAHVQVLADPVSPDRLARGKTKDAPGALGLLPGVGLAVGGYNALHRGKDVKLGRGSTFRIVVGDDLADAECYVSPNGL